MDIGSLYSDYLKSTVTSSSNLERTLNGTNSSTSDDELLDACKQFESYFYEQIFKEMEKAMVPDDSSDANDTLIDYYKENLISQYSKSIVDQSGNNSLAQQLYTQMKRNYSIPDTDTKSAEETAAASQTVEGTDSTDSTDTSTDATSAVQSV